MVECLNYSNHISFASVNCKAPFSSITLTNTITGEDYQQVVWPDHCVQGSDGAKFLDSLIVKPSDVIVQKGTHREIDSYSGFFDNNHANSTGEAKQFKKKDRIFFLDKFKPCCYKYS